MKLIERPIERLERSVPCPWQRHFERFSHPNVVNVLIH